MYAITLQKNGLTSRPQREPPGFMPCRARWAGLKNLPVDSGDNLSG